MRARRGILSPARPFGVAAAVPTLVVVPDDWQHGLKGAHRTADLLAFEGVFLHDLPLFFCQPSWLEQDFVGYADLADVMQVSATVQGHQVKIG